MEAEPHIINSKILWAKPCLEIEICCNSMTAYLLKDSNLAVQAP